MACIHTILNNSLKSHNDLLPDLVITCTLDEGPRLTDEKVNCIVENGVTNGDRGDDVDDNMVDGDDDMTDDGCGTILVAVLNERYIIL